MTDAHTPACGCRVKRAEDFSWPVNTDIIFHCRLHRAARRMRDALTEIIEDDRRFLRDRVGDKAVRAGAVNRARAALAAAGVAQ